MFAGLLRMIMPQAGARRKQLACTTCPPAGYHPYHAERTEHRGLASTSRTPKAGQKPQPIRALKPARHALPPHEHSVFGSQLLPESGQSPARPQHSSRHRSTDSLFCGKPTKQRQVRPLQLVQSALHPAANRCSLLIRGFYDDHPLQTPIPNAVESSCCGSLVLSQNHAPARQHRTAFCRNALHYRSC